MGGAKTLKDQRVLVVPTGGVVPSVPRGAEPIRKPDVDNRDTDPAEGCFVELQYATRVPVARDRFRRERRKTVEIAFGLCNSWKIPEVAMFGRVFGNSRWSVTPRVRRIKAATGRRRRSDFAFVPRAESSRERIEKIKTYGCKATRLTTKKIFNVFATGKPAEKTPRSGFIMLSAVVLRIFLKIFFTFNRSVAREAFLART